MGATYDDLLAVARRTEEPRDTAGVVAEITRFAEIVPTLEWPEFLSEFIDHIAGGKDEDVIDWRPRGAYGTGAALTGRTCSTSTDPVTTKKDGTTDPCSWFEMTDRADDVVTITSSALVASPRSV